MRSQRIRIGDIIKHVDGRLDELTRSDLESASKGFDKAEDIFSQSLSKDDMESHVYVKNP